MQPLTSGEVVDLLSPYLREHPPESMQPALSPEIVNQILIYMDLLLKWNERTNLTAIRVPRQIIERHFGESLFAASFLPSEGSLLDLGSGAGFPGLPIQLLRPELKITLAEAHQKKASFLREVIRRLTLRTQVWADRAESLRGVQVFDRVILRAVDEPGAALRVALELSPEVWVLCSARTGASWDGALVLSESLVPNTKSSYLIQLRSMLFHVEQR